jgi:hypothetical protein
MYVYFERQHIVLSLKETVKPKDFQNLYKELVELSNKTNPKYIDILNIEDTLKSIINMIDFDKNKQLDDVSTYYEEDTTDLKYYLIESATLSDIVIDYEIREENNCVVADCSFIQEYTGMKSSERCMFYKILNEYDEIFSQF